jgi:hypothetical protein
VVKQRGVTVSWTAHPARRRPAELALFVAVACVTLAGIGYLFESGFLTVLAGVFLVAGVAPFLFPTRYQIDDDGVKQVRLGHRRERRWADLRRVEVGSGAALVSPFARRRWLDRHRGLIVYFDGGDREQVIAALRERIP